MATPMPVSTATTTARGRLRLMPSPTTTAVSTTPPSTAVPTAMATPTPASTATTTARGRLRPSPTAMAMAALDTTVEKVTTWTTAFHSYMPRPKTITTKNLFQQDLHHKTGRYCQTKTKKHVKVQ